MNIEERHGEAFEFAEHLTVIGRKLRIGDTAPAFSLDRFDAVEGAIRTVLLSDTAGTVRLLNVVNSLDTPVCQVETRRWEKLRADLPNAVTVYTISMDLPFAQSRWNLSESVQHQLLSSHRSKQFGRDYGVLLKQWRLLQRAVFVIDSSDLIAHAEYVADQMNEPNYDAAAVAVQNASGL
ncbi:Redoxin domain protein [Methylorubrum extorquens CM4]|uniref:Redoxin domain protein n=2 Tax=Methylorubrum extorquens TaxID=408 RepID=B7L1T6_METC4|nr:Redoxin domain protein [Methylorubrum extorquens CM4]